MWNRHQMMGWEGAMGMNVISIFMILLLIVITVLVIFTIIKVSKGNQGSQTSASPNHTDNEALSILKKRFAQGDISEEEYLKMKDVLKDNNPI